MPEISTEMKTVYDTVKELLELDVKYRDSDKVLWCRIVSNALGERMRVMSAYELLCEIAENKLPSFESCSRVRRMIQEDSPELRGTKYKERLKQMEEVTKTLGYQIDLK